MVKRISILCLALLLALLYSFTGSRKERVDFSRVERRMLHIPTAGLFDGTGYFTVTSADMERDGWSFPVEDGVLFTPDFRHEPVGWYIMSPEVKHEVRAAMQGVVRLVRKTDLGKTVVVLHVCPSRQDVGGVRRLCFCRAVCRVGRCGPWRGLYLFRPDGERRADEPVHAGSSRW